MAAKQITPRALVLAAVALAAAAVLVAIWPTGTADTTGSGRPGTAVGVPVEDPAIPPALGLEGIQAPRAVPANKRDLFRFGSAPPAGGETAGPDPDDDPAGGTPAGRRGSPPPAAVDDAPVMPPPPPPIPLRFVGLLQTAKGPMAVLTDGKFVYNALEGDNVEGRWRVVKIGAESVVIERIDGTGRQTLRLPGE